MKCSKCGEICSEKQAVCMKCGNPIQVNPDLNLIEEELANSVLELMDSDEDFEDSKTEDINDNGNTKVFNRSDDDFLRDTAVYLDITIPDIKDESLEYLEMASRYNHNQERPKKVQKNDEYQVNALKPNKVNGNRKPDEKNKKIKKIVASCVAAIIVAGAVAGVYFLKKGAAQKDDFNSVYTKGVEYYTSKDYDMAIDSFQNAIHLAKTVEDEKKANKSLYDTYMKKGVKNLSQSEIEECIDILKELIKLDGDNLEYYKTIIKLYEKADMQEELEAYKESLMNTSIGKKLGISSVTPPEFSVEQGEYNRYISVEIIYEEGLTAYYTTDGSTPSEKSQLYEGPIEIKEQGETVIKAVTLNDKNEKSAVSTAKYEIKLESIEAPKVTPDSGTYTEPTKIEVEVPDGMKAYYTIDEYGKTPDTESEEYTGPIDMPRGKNVFSVILVDESGMCSDITENIYKYNVDRRYNYDDALSLLKEKLKYEHIIVDLSGNMPDDKYLEFSYSEIAIIENDEYNIIVCNEKNSDGKTIDTYIYGVDTVTGDVKSIRLVDEEYKVN